MSNQLVITLSSNEGLVLFELLARFCNDNKLSISDAAEARVLCDIHAQLESSLVQPLMPDYRKQLEDARESLRPAKR